MTVTQQKLSIYALLVAATITFIAGVVALLQADGFLERLWAFLTSFGVLAGIAIILGLVPKVNQMSIFQKLEMFYMACIVGMVGTASMVLVLFGKRGMDIFMAGILLPGLGCLLLYIVWLERRRIRACWRLGWRKLASW